MPRETKSKRLFVCVTPSQHEWLKSRAAGYGIPMSALVLLATEAYARAYDEVPAEGALVAVNYGAWVRATSRLGGVDRRLRGVDRSLAGVAAALGGPGVAGLHGVRRSMVAVAAARADVAAMRADVARATSALVALASREQLVDPAMAQDPTAAAIASEGGS